MQKVGIVSDSTCDITEDIREDLGIELAPVHVIIDGTEYRDRIEINAASVYEAQIAGKAVTSSGCNGEDWAVAYENAAKNAEEVLALSISPLLSTTYRSGEMAIEVTELPVTLVNSGTICAPQGMAAMMAARVARQGADMDEVRRVADHYLANGRIVAVVDTVEYMRRGGRLGSLEEKVGSLDGYRPVVRLYEKGWMALDKDETRAGTIEKMVALMENDLAELGCDRDTPLVVAVDHAVADEEAHTLLERVKNTHNVKEAFIWDLSPTVGVHLGPGMLGVGYAPVL